MLYSRGVLFNVARCSEYKTKTYQVRTADTNVDNIGDRFASIAFPLPANHCLTELLHVIQYFIHICCHLQIHKLTLGANHRFLEKVHSLTIWRME